MDETALLRLGENVWTGDLIRVIHKDVYYQPGL